MSDTISILTSKMFCWIKIKYRIWKILRKRLEFSVFHYIAWMVLYFLKYSSNHLYFISNNLLQTCHHYCTLLRNIRLLPLSPFPICLINSCISPHFPYLEQKYFWLMRQFLFFQVEMIVVMSHSVKSRSWTDSACDYKQICK